MNKQETTEAIQTPWIYSTVKQFTTRHPAFCVGGIRSQLFHCETNGLKESGALVRNGRRILIKESTYFAWLEAQSQGGSK